MGIKHFFTWFKQHFSSHIISFQKQDLPDNVNIDTFMIDLNGIFHNSAQKIYQYGNHARPKSILGRKHTLNITALQEKCFVDVCNTIEELITITKPQKKLVLCIDGVAPQSKQNQQRQRRYRSAEDSDASSFDTCSITPGTKFMDYLSKYIDWYIRKRVSESPTWASLEIIFSNEKVPGEGEHKLINYIRKFGDENETFCINALDADLVMLSLATHKQKFFLLREDLFNNDVDFMYVDIAGVRKELVNLLQWNDISDEKKSINDFILICFLCGNDFLPNIPSIAIMDKGLDTIINLYRIACKKENSYLTTIDNKFIKSTFKTFLQLISISEKPLLEEKILHKNDYIPDPLLQKYTNESISTSGISTSGISTSGISTSGISTSGINLDFEGYKEEYYKSKNMSLDLEKICHTYLQGCQWILTYYTEGISDWTWLFPYHYSPFAGELVASMDTFTLLEPQKTAPLLPFQQLLCVLPPKSSFLVPSPLSDLFKKDSPLSQFYPETFNINYEGKKKRWEGIVELPVVNVDAVKKWYTIFAKRISDLDKKRNIIGKSYSYKFSADFLSEFKSFYGTIRTRVEVNQIEF